MIEKAQKALRKIRAAKHEAKKSAERSPMWDNVRNKFLKKNKSCAACGSTKELQVHHVKPFHLHPELELEMTNLITLCMDEHDCHVNIGHGDSFRAYNPNVREDAAKFLSASDEERKVIAESAKKGRLLAG